jgi:hypothetical protein
MEEAQRRISGELVVHQLAHCSGSESKRARQFIFDWSGRHGRLLFISRRQMTCRFVLFRKRPPFCWLTVVGRAFQI